MFRKRHDVGHETQVAGVYAREFGIELAEWARLIRGSLFNYAGVIVSGVVGIAIVPTMLDHLGLEAYGLWVAVLAVVLLVGEVDIGLSTIVTREVAADPAYERDSTAQLVASAAVGYLVLALAGGLLIGALGATISGGLMLSATARQAAPFVFAMGGVLSVSGRVLAFSIALLYGRRRFGSANAITAAVTVLGGVGTVLVLLTGGGLRAVAAWQAGVTSVVAIAVLGAVLLIQPALRNGPPRPSWRLLRQHARFGIASQILTLGVNLLWVIAPSLVAAISGTRLVASYDVGRKFPSALSALSWRSSEAFFPAASRESRVGNFEGRRALLKGVTHWNLALVLPVSLVLFLLAPNLLSVWLDSPPPHATTVLRFLALAVVADAFGLGAVHILWAAGEMRALLRILSATTLGGLGISVILLWEFGVVGVVIALLAMAAMRSALVLRAASLEHELPVVQLLTTAVRGLFVPASLAAVVTLAVRELVHPASWLGLIAAGVVGIGVYLAAAWLAPSATKDRVILNSPFSVPRRHSDVVSRRVRGVLRQIGPLRSSWYLVRELWQMASSPRPNAAVLDDEFSERVDPWDYHSPSEQGRHSTAVGMLDTLRGPRRFGRAIEIGCAEGMFTELLVPRCDELLAVDISGVALERARFRCAGARNLTFERCDLLDAPELGSFNLVVAMDVLDYFIRPRDFGHARGKILQLIEDDGYLLVSTTNQSEVFERAWWRRWIRRGRTINDSLASFDGLSLLKTASIGTHTLSLYVRRRA